MIDPRSIPVERKGFLELTSLSRFNARFLPGLPSHVRASLSNMEYESMNACLSRTISSGLLSVPVLWCCVAEGYTITRDAFEYLLGGYLAGGVC